ncbi:putative exo-alpha-sialidase [Arabidopsis thaliana]|uniref:AT3G52170-like helix-turn-helix domain-containing protein n=3 Tax=Arabidopsis TaxID=3701 RepID=A0A178UK22_ARATH|nr:hypothetical protein ISN45_At05g054190 [Arabidopsis thaliana x Arabidopsis arenosa]KAG7613424.1 hypothetical protein ISN44_As05g053420 [Arabidopsis suecica]OAO94083.1 hypothetical protein AXX17_AT5G57550 [Arabidopsis thaliana]KAG7613425.1 hypothetical protein ISN44_As05g053420 [Arabidopsis suecica]CAA0410609.1 unnamed protein product [Arabidopsis thaliana]
MILKQLKQFTLSATRRNAVFKTDVKRLARFYGSPAVCESLTTSKIPKRLSKDDRRALVESFVNEYRATNAGRFPSLDATHKQVGGSYYIVRDIFQELKLKPKAHVPIVAKALSEVSSSVPGDASSHSSPAPVPTVEAKALSEVSPSVPADASSHLSPSPVPIVEAKALSEVSPSVPADTSSHFSPAPVPIVEAEALSVVSPSVPADTSSHFSPAPVPIVEAKTLSEVSPSVPDDASSHFSPVVVEPEFQAGSVDIEIGSEQRPDIIDTSHSNSDDESNFQGNNLVITATDDKRETEATQGIENSETDEERNLTHLGNQESKADHLEGADVSADVVPTETRQISETGAGEVKETETGEVKERSSSWSNIMSFAKEFANFWR